MNLTREKVDFALDVELSWCDKNTQDGCSEGGFLWQDNLEVYPH